MKYDAAGQLLERITDGIIYGITKCDSYITLACFYELPTYGTSVCIAPDTARFGYDDAGRLVRADNNYARVRRSYWSEGTLRKENLQIRSYYSSGSIPCEKVPAGETAEDFSSTFVTEYTYDLDRRRTSLKHAGGTQQYDWTDPSGRGLLQGITDTEGNVYTFEPARAQDRGAGRPLADVHRGHARRHRRG